MKCKRQTALPIGNVKYIVLTLLLWVVFFGIQVLVLSELPLTVLALLLSLLLFYDSEPGEGYLYALGVATALVIEVGLGLIARSQTWAHASLLGVPFWLPLMWGYGFVVIRRIGNFVVSYSGWRSKQRRAKR